MPDRERPEIDREEVYRRMCGVGWDPYLARAISRLDLPPVEPAPLREPQ